ncbi:MAG: response regulator [Acidobacteriales bacterium]|nr:response regulator [Terriglobales bacterium]
MGEIRNSCPPSRRRAFAAVLLCLLIAAPAPAATPETPIEELFISGCGAPDITTEGIVRSYVVEGELLRLRLAGVVNAITVTMPAGSVDATLLPDAQIKVSGACRTLYNNKRQRIGFELQLASADRLKVVHPAPQDPFQAVLAPIKDLLSFTPQGQFVHRMKVRGWVTLQRASGSTYMADGTGAIFLQRPAAPNLNPGDEIEAAGFPDYFDNNVVLRDAIVRTTGGHQVPLPRVLATTDELDDRYNNEFVQLNGTVVSQRQNNLVLQVGKQTFDAELDVRNRNAHLPRFEGNTEVQVQGIYWTRPSESGRIVSYRLFLRTADDIRVLRTPSWWTLPRIGRLLGLVTIFGLLGFFWVWMLRRQVRNQTSLLRRQHDQELQLKEQLRQAQKLEAVGRLAGGIAHDFNNVLTVIRGYSEILLAEHNPNDPEHEPLEEIRKAADRASALTAQLLAFSRQQVLAPRTLELNTILDNLEKMLRRLLSTEVVMQLRRDPALWPVKADPTQMEQVIMNLVVNANDAMPQGGTLTIETRNVTLDDLFAKEHLGVAAGQYARVSVTDTGVGMSPDLTSRIFEPFFTTKEQGRGTGLGLATSYGIVKQSGGHIEVLSRLGSGTTFHVYLPAAEVVEEMPRAAEPEATASHRGHETVLLIEDEEGLRTLVRRVLSAQGYVVLDAPDPETALELSRDHRGPIHLLLTDVVLKEGNGQVVAQEITRARPETKVIFMSGYSQDAVLQHGQLRPNTAFLSKPFTTAALAAKVRETLDATSTVEQI